jgi:HEAT repeat protein
MQFLRGALPALMLALTLAPAYAQDPLQELRRYDYQDRSALDAISKQIVAAGKDATTLAALEAGLVAVLTDPQATDGAKLEVCTFLQRMGTARSVPALVPLLVEPKTSDLARLALERNADPSAGVALRGALNASRGATLVGIINSVGNRGDGLAVATLKALTASAEPLVAEAAVNALGKIGGASAVVALRTVKNPALPVAPALLRAAGTLAAAGKRTDAKEIYESLLRPAQPEVIRSGALMGLVAVGAPKLGELALRLARTAPEPQLQRVAGRVLGMQSDPVTVKSGISAFASLPTPAQLALLAAWADRREKAATPVALEALKSADSEVRVAAIQTVARVAGLAAVMPLSVIAQEGEQAGVARTALARMGGSGVEDALLRLASIGPGKIPPAVILVLGERPTPRSTAALLTIAASKEQETRVSVTALKVLEKTATPTQADGLIKLLVSTPDDQVRDGAQTALVAIAQRSGDREGAAQPLLVAMGSASVAGQVALLGALAELGGAGALGALTQATASPNLALKNAALSGLANTWSDSSALPTLLLLVRQSASKEDRVQALRGSLRLLATDDRMPAPQKLAQLTELFRLAERVEEKRQALSVLREVRLPAAAAMAGQSLDNPELIAEATDAILYLAAPQRKDRTNLPAVTGNEMRAALEKLITTTADEKIREQARKLRG